MKKSYLYITSAAILWGTMSIFVSKLTEFGLSSMQIVFVRALTASIMLAAYLLAKNRSLFKIRLRDCPIFIGTGIISFTFFSYCYFTAMHMCSVSIAAVLLYTAPAFVMLMSALLFKERLTAVKLVSVILTVVGCVLVSGAFGADTQLSPVGILFGLGAGFGYALYSIFGRYGIDKYHTLTVTFYTFVFAAIASLPFFVADGISQITFNAKSTLWMLAVGIFTSALPYLLYTEGLKRVEAGRASVIATIEPVVASVIGVLMFGESMGIYKLCGIALVLFAVFLINLKNKQKI